jgi:prepilin-type N-terminal cleavage/methylation domain-containing protein
MRRNAHSRAFTLIELLVVIGIITILAVLSLPIYTSMVQHAHCSLCASKMHDLGIAMLAYANDNDGQLPGRVTTGDRWPTLLLPYVGNDARVYVDPGDPVAMKIPISELISNTVNNSSFIFNGFNDMGALNNPNYQVCLFNVPISANLILIGQQIPGGNNFYLDVNNGDQNDVLNKVAYFGGSNYVFADGSLRFVPLAKYNDNMWLVNTNYVIPQ